MDIYQIILTHNRMWSLREVLCFFIILVIVSIILKRFLRNRRIIKIQAAAVILLVCFLGIVLASTVFTRTSSGRVWELVPFWSWYEVFFNHSQSLLVENLLNCILLMPAGLILPFVYYRKISLKKAWLFGWVISFTIELCQLVFMRGLYEWDDMIHNALGCLVVAAVGNRIINGYKEMKTKDI